MITATPALVGQVGNLNSGTNHDNDKSIGWWCWFFLQAAFIEIQMGPPRVNIYKFASPPVGCSRSCLRHILYYSKKHSENPELCNLAQTLSSAKLLSLFEMVSRFLVILIEPIFRKDPKCHGVTLQPVGHGSSNSGEQLIGYQLGGFHFRAGSRTAGSFEIKSRLSVIGERV